MELKSAVNTETEIRRNPSPLASATSALSSTPQSRNLGPLSSKIAVLPQHLGQGETLDSACFEMAKKFAGKIETWIEERGQAVPKAFITYTSQGGILFQWFGKETKGKQLAISFQPNREIECLRFNNEDVEEEIVLDSFDKLTGPLSWLIGNVSPMTEKVTALKKFCTGPNQTTTHMLKLSAIRL